MNCFFPHMRSADISLTKRLEAFIQQLSIVLKPCGILEGITFRYDQNRPFGHETLGYVLSLIEGHSRLKSLRLQVGIMGESIKWHIPYPETKLPRLCLFFNCMETGIRIAFSAPLCFSKKIK